MYFVKYMTVPRAIGFHTNKIKLDAKKYYLRECSGNSRIRRLWKYYYEEADIIIFVIDVSDEERFEEARRFL